MIIGHGDIAKVLTDRADRCYFAAGVSNSGETLETEYQREIALLRKQDRSAHLVYFSSLCVFYSDTRYAQHKRHMEWLVKDEFKQHCIVRLGNILWGTNPHTLVNHLRLRQGAGLTLDIQDVYRHVIELDEFQYWMSMIPPWPCELNAPGRRLKVGEIVRQYVRPSWPVTVPTQDMIDDWAVANEMLRNELAKFGQGNAVA